MVGFGPPANHCARDARGSAPRASPRSRPRVHPELARARAHLQHARELPAGGAWRDVRHAYAPRSARAHPRLLAACARAARAARAKPRFVDAMRQRRSPNSEVALAPAARANASVARALDGEKRRQPRPSVPSRIGGTRATGDQLARAPRAPPRASARTLGARPRRAGAEARGRARGAARTRARDASRSARRPRARPWRAAGALRITRSRASSARGGARRPRARGATCGAARGARTADRDGHARDAARRWSASARDASITARERRRAALPRGRGSRRAWP